MTWVNARPEGAEVAVLQEPATVGAHETGFVLPRGLALEDTPSSAALEYWDGDSWEPMTEITDPEAVLGATEFRVLYDPEQPLGGAWQTGAADDTSVRLSYNNRGDLLWAHDLDRIEPDSLTSIVFNRVFG